MLTQKLFLTKTGIFVYYIYANIEHIARMVMALSVTCS